MRCLVRRFGLPTVCVTDSLRGFGVSTAALDATEEPAFSIELSVSRRRLKRRRVIWRTKPWDQGVTWSNTADKLKPHFRDTDESAKEPEQDPDTSITLSLVTIPEASATERIPWLRCSISHRFSPQTKIWTSGRTQNHECCPLVMEVKPFPHRRMKPGQKFCQDWVTQSRIWGFNVTTFLRSTNTLFERSQSPLLVTTGPTWLFFRTQVPRGVGGWPGYGSMGFSRIPAPCSFRYSSIWSQDRPDNRLSAWGEAWPTTTLILFDIGWLHDQQPQL